MYLVLIFLEKYVVNHLGIILNIYTNEDVLWEKMKTWEICKKS